MNGCLLFLLSLLFGLMVCIALLLGLSLASDIRNDFQSANLDLRIEIIGAPKATASPEAERMPVLIYVINDQPALSVPTSVPLLPQSAPNYQITNIRGQTDALIGWMAGRHWRSQLLGGGARCL